MPVRYGLKDIRGAYKARNSWWGYFILHPVASLGVWVVANFTPLRPEVICVSSLLVGFFALPCFASGDPALLLTGGAIAFASNLLDAMDGKLARLKHMATPLGGYLDAIIDLVKHQLYVIALVWGQYRMDGDFAHIAWGAALLFVFGFNYANENLLGRIRAFLPPAPPRAEASARAGVLARIDGFFARRSLQPAPCAIEVVTLMFIVGPMINRVMPCLVFGCVALALYSLLFTVMTLKRTRGLSRGLAKDRAQLECLAAMLAPEAASSLAAGGPDA